MARRARGLPRAPSRGGRRRRRRWCSSTRPGRSTGPATSSTRSLPAGPARPRLAGRGPRRGGRGLRRLGRGFALARRRARAPRRLRRGVLRLLRGRRPQLSRAAAGCTFWFAPGSVVLHHRGRPRGASASSSFVHPIRNRWFLIGKNVPRGWSSGGCARSSAASSCGAGPRERAPRLPSAAPTGGARLAPRLLRQRRAIARGRPLAEERSTGCSVARWGGAPQPAPPEVAPAAQDGAAARAARTRAAPGRVRADHHRAPAPGPDPPERRVALADGEYVADAVVQAPPPSPRRRSPTETPWTTRASGTTSSARPASRARSDQSVSSAYANSSSSKSPSS